MNGSPARFQANLDGIGHVLRDLWLGVPLYQRSYAWDTEEVESFWTDLRGSRESDYFVGTIVLTPGINHRMEIIDGQQRLATSAMILAAIRDYFAQRGDVRAEAIQKRYLLSENLQTGDGEPRLLLSASDAEFFLARVVLGAPPGASPELNTSAVRIQQAYAYLREQVRKDADDAGPNWTAHLLNWVEFLDNRLRVILVQVASEADAFLIFETMNDRGIELNIGDLLKNYLLGRAREHLAEADRRWNGARNALDAENADSKFSGFIRHYWSSINGATREKELYRRLRGQIASSEDALAFLHKLESAAPLYAALLDSRDPHWASLRVGSPDVETLLRFGLEQNRPLLLAAMESLTASDLSKLIKALIAWTVRGLVVGGIGGGTAERLYAEAATKIRSAGLRTPAQILRRLEPIVARDPEFREQFAVAGVRNLRLTEYLLLAIENDIRNQSEPAAVSDAEEETAEVVKVMGPRAASVDWPQFEQDEIPSMSYRLGNAVLLERGLVQDFIGAGWRGKQAIMKKSSFVTTQSVADYREWSPGAIGKRQRSFADRALTIWPR